jgi:hypothetical protein
MLRSSLFSSAASKIPGAHLPSSSAASSQAAFMLNSLFLCGSARGMHRASAAQRVFPQVSRGCERALLFGKRGGGMQPLSRANNGAATASASHAFSSAAVMATARRFQSQQASSEQQKQQSQSAEGEQQKQQQQQQAEGGEQQKAGAGAGAEQKKEGGGGFKAQWEGIKRDITEFPDIYNGPNMLSVAFFTIFCLSSTGTQVEQNWWLDHWAVDQDSHLRPWTWALHALHMNNFLSMVFAILLLHNSLHPLSHGLAGGANAAMQYCGLVAVLSGFSMWAAQRAWYDPSQKDVMGRPLKGEKQYGPWDIASAVMVMQYLRLGIPPHRLLLSFNGWVKYACCVGAVCILYYDPQPVFFGTLYGFLLCRFAPAFRGVAAV